MKKSIKINEFLKGLRFEYLGLAVLAVLMAPIVFLFIRDGAGGAVFEVHDQLDETILNYYFSAKHFGMSTYPEMMCGVPAEALKPFCPLFTPLYAIFNIYSAFIIQYFIVITTAFYGTFFVIRKITDNGFISFVCATLFASLPVHCVYGNVVAGTPLLIFVILSLRDKELSKGRKVLRYLLLVYYALSTSLALSGWVVVGMLGLAYIIEFVIARKNQKELLIAELIITISYVLCNLDIIKELFGIDSYVSHRVEFGLGRPQAPWYTFFVNLLKDGDLIYEAESKHEILIPVIGIAAIMLLVVGKTRKYWKQYLFAGGMIIVNALLYAFFSSGFVFDIQQRFQGMIKSFQFARFYYFNVGLWYILFGISVAIIAEAVREKISTIAVIALAVYSLVAFAFIQRTSGIFNQNVKQIIRGQGSSGYVSMRNVYCEDLMAQIDDAIDEDNENFRVAHIGICPIVSLVHGFNTIDGYSNNYPLEYKHEFREVIAGELELNEFNRTYYDNWGNRCYILYHDWGNSYMLSRDFKGSISNLQINFDKLKELNCHYIFTAAPIEDFNEYPLEEVGVYDTQYGFWRIWVYRVM